MGRDQFVTSRIGAKVAKPLVAGHPWMIGELGQAQPVGQLVELADPRGRVVAWGLVDEQPIVVRVLGRGKPPKRDFSSLVTERVLRADAVRRRLVTADTNAYRVVSGSGDGLPGVVIDRYADLAVIRLYSKAWEVHLDTLVQAIRKLAWAQGLFRKLGVKRVDGRRGGETLSGPPTPEKIVVEEHGMKLLVRPWDGQKTGLFLDQREHRALVGRWSPGRCVGNLFGYNGGFSVAAALGGAAMTVTVDIAAQALEDAKENFRINGLNPDHHGFVCTDVFDWQPDSTLDFIVVDPPSLAHDKDASEAALNAYRKLHRRLGGVVPKDGLLATSSCTSRVSLTQWRHAVAMGLAKTGEWVWHWCSGHAPDHPYGLQHTQAEYLKFALLRRRD